MKELEKAIDQLKKENDRIEKAQNRAKLLNQKDKTNLKGMLKQKER
ncbi:hypothetical protein HMPREF9628_01611, partial [Peptoanaerobacter stomatis]